MLSLLLACAPATINFADSALGPLPPPEEGLQGQSADDQLGTAMAWDGRQLHVSAPGAQQLHHLQIGQDADTSALELGEGHSLAVVDGELQVSASLSSPSADRALLSTPEGLARLVDQELWVDDSPTSLPGWGSAIAWWQGAPVVGLAQGDVAVWTPLETLERPEALDRAGSALVACDVDGDGEEELAVGAPGAGRVHIYDALSLEPVSIGPASEAFGSALACGDQGLFIGAPLAQERGGAVYLYDGELSQVGTGVGLYGSSLLVVDEALFVGAPGERAEQAGRVERLF